MSPAGLRALVRPLRVFAFDPSLGSRHGNVMTLSVAHEPLTPGPRGRNVAVIDYDASNRCYYRPINLDDPDVMMEGGLPPSEADPGFHQQMAYAVAMKTVENFSYALGRRVEWRKRLGKDRGGTRVYESPPLRVFPHAMQDANAYYDPTPHAVFLGYFEASRRDAGGNLPGQIVYTCLSHDIIAHETTHALLHDLRPHYLTPTGWDAAAFHEALADVVALLQHFGFEAALVDHLMETGGRLHDTQLAPDVAPTPGQPTRLVAERSQPNVLIGLAQQFGEALEMRAALRSALGTAHDASALQRLFEPHERGAILVACVFDAFLSVYARQAAAFLRLIQPGGGLPGGRLSREVAGYLAGEAAKMARQFLSICVRAIDYCPPVDISFGDYLRALVTVDSDLVQVDTLGYRETLIEAFRLRGVEPQGVRSYAAESLRWEPPLRRGRALRCDGLHFDAIQKTDPKTPRENARALHAFGKQYARELELDPKVPIHVESFRPIYRVGQDGQVGFQVVAQLVQELRESSSGAGGGGAGSRIGGSTLIIDMPSGLVRYAVYKRIHSKRRARQQKEFTEYWRERVAGPFTAVPPGSPTLDFARLHRGY
jgi:hypothetical protein